MSYCISVNRYSKCLYSAPLTLGYGLTLHETVMWSCGFDIGYHEAIITVMNTSLYFNYSGTNQICH